MTDKNFTKTSFIEVNERINRDFLSRTHTRMRAEDAVSLLASICVSAEV